MASDMRKPANFVGYTEGYSVRVGDFKPAMGGVTMESQFLRFHGLTFQFELQTFGISAGKNDFVGIADGIPFAYDNVSELVNLCGVHCLGSFLVFKMACGQFVGGLAALVVSARGYGVEIVSCK